MPARLTDAAATDWSGYEEPKWLLRPQKPWYIIISCHYYIISWFTSRCEECKYFWLLATEQKRCLSGIYPGPGRAVPQVIAFCLVWCDSDLLSWGSQSPPAAPGSLLGPERSLLCLRCCRCYPKFAAPGAENQTDCITESPCALSSGFPTSVGVQRL